MTELLRPMLMMATYRVLFLAFGVTLGSLLWRGIEESGPSGNYPRRSTLCEGTWRGLPCWYIPLLRCSSCNIAAYQGMRWRQFRWLMKTLLTFNAY